MGKKKLNEDRGSSGQLNGEDFFTDAVVPREPGSVDSTPAVEDTVVKEAVAYINDVYNGAALKASKSIARHVIEVFFNNDITAARSHSPTKGISYRALCEHPGLVISRVTLGNMISVECQEQFLLEHGIDVQSLSYTHQVKLLRIPDGRDKLKLAGRAIAEKLSVRKLESLVHEAKQLIGRRRPLVPDLHGNYRDNPFLLLKDSRRMDFVLDTEKLGKLSPKARRRFHEEVIATRTTLERSLNQVEIILMNLTEIEEDEEKDETEG